MRCWSARTASIAACLLLAGCGLGETPQRATILEAQPVAGGTVLEVTQRLALSPTMQEALDRGIPLRLAYRIHWCAAAARASERSVLELRYLSLSRQYEVRPSPGSDADVLRFARRSALLAALDRVRLPLQLVAPDCGGRISVALDLTALPTPLRFPALLEPDQWRLVSPEHAWPSAHD